MTYSIQNWPDDVPSCVMPLSPSGGPRDNRYSFEADGPAPPKERPMSSWAPEVYAITLVPLSVDQFTLFQNWYRQDLAHGTQPFVFNHPITLERLVWKIVKNSPPYEVSKIGRIPRDSGLRRISLSFSIMSMPVDTPAEYLAREASGLILQEQEDRIITEDEVIFDG